MDRVAVAGFSLHHIDVARLERVKQRVVSGSEPAPQLLADLLGASEVVCLSTCNRCEVVYARENGHPPGRDDLECLAEGFGLAPDDPLRARLFLHSGPRAARHLFRVVSSLDSLVVGEDQILSQVRAAFEESRAFGLTGKILGPLFEHAWQIGKKVRSATDLARHPISVVSLGTAFLAQRLARCATPPRIAVIGAGATGAHAARSLRAAGLAVALIVNRSPGRARELATEVGARVLSLEEFRNAPEPVDALVSATSASGYVLDRSSLCALAARTPSGGRLVAVDLALPRDLEPVEDARIDRIDLETLRERAEANRARRAAAAAQAELLIEEKLEALAREQAQTEVAAPFATVLAEAREVFELELSRLTSGRLAHLGQRERQAVERWARVAFGRLSHVPLAALKRLARQDALPRGEWEGLE